ncbi:ABC transporter substrate-binding protein [Bradyrhizobium sp. CCBAU 11361]|uniref:ABC transporter substrate-binding protein n=1 Tax=Bradyrhizobium sp. CCBAU 11361 TaxID=1630812 RepID=UPI002302CDD3|nr:ABC transporter substrate-binding protein [Bradyrhizobium sp. CCBAU 11361]MDA9489913.1 hypothetical protein [Bradyrhizobium sp. CCBAU 11361]
MLKRLLLMLPIVIGVTAAGHAPQATAQELTKVRVGLVRLPSNSPLYIGLDKGFFRDEGLDLQLTFFDAASAVPVAVVSGDVDISVGGLTAAFYNLAAKGGLKIISSTVREKAGYHLDAFLITTKAYDEGFRSWKDLTGKRVAITTAGSTYHLKFVTLAKKNGVDISRVTFVPLQSLQHQAAAFAGNQVDAASLPALVAENFVKTGQGRLMGWAGDETPSQNGVIAVSPATIEKRRMLIEKFLRAYDRSVALYYDNFLGNGSQSAVSPAQQQEMLETIARYVHSTVENLKGAMPYYDRRPEVDVEDMGRQLTVWQELGMAPKSTNIKALVDLSFTR